MLLIWPAGILPAGQEAWLFLPLLASAYGFCQVHVKTDDGAFLGFPSLWNVVALYLYMLPLGAWSSLVIVIVLAILTFVPSRYLYPSQPGRLNRVATLLGVPWTFLFVWVMWKLPHAGETALDQTTLRWAWISLVYPLFYLGASWTISVAHWRKRPTKARVGSRWNASGRFVGPSDPMALLNVDNGQKQASDGEENDQGQDRDLARFPDKE